MPAACSTVERGNDAAAEDVARQRQGPVEVLKQAEAAGLGAGADQ
jgi:hypothetical protein